MLLDVVRGREILLANLANYTSKLKNYPWKFLLCTFFKIDIYDLIFSFFIYRG